MPADADIDELYALPLGEFVAARNALVKRLKAAGDKEEAARVASLRKPAAGAWVVNQLARTAADDVRALLAAGRKLAEAQAGALRGAGSAPLRKAAETERAALRRLLEQARPLVRTDQQLNRVAEILRTAAADADVGDLMAAGRLTEEPEPAGFGLLAATGDEGDEAAAEAEDTAATEEADRRARERERAELVRRAEKAEQVAERMERRAEAAEREARERRQAADLARQEAADRRAAVDQSNNLP